MRGVAVSLGMANLLSQVSSVVMPTGVTVTVPWTQIVSMSLTAASTVFLAAIGYLLKKHLDRIDGIEKQAVEHSKLHTLYAEKFSHTAERFDELKSDVREVQNTVRQVALDAGERGRKLDALMQQLKVSAPTTPAYGYNVVEIADEAPHSDSAFKIKVDRRSHG